MVETHDEQSSIHVTDRDPAAADRRGDPRRSRAKIHGFCDFAKQGYKRTRRANGVIPVQELGLGSSGVSRGPQRIRIPF